MPGGARALVDRSGVIEAEHLASVAVCGPDGTLIHAAGDVGRVFFARSSAKPFQAKVSQQLGAGLGPEHLALACASHEGDPIHVALVRDMLESAGLVESNLGCPPARPLSERSDRRLAGAGDGEPRRLFNNCSGKHAAMLRAAQTQGWDLASYLSPDHPLQRAIAEEMAVVGAAVGGEVGVDGCGAPVFEVSTESLARGFARLAIEDEYAAVRTSMHRFPALVSGAGRHDAVTATELYAVAKRGAEACLGVAVFGFGSIALKIWDGADRAVGPVLSAVLDRLGWVPHGAVARLGMELARTVLGGGTVVGAVRAEIEFDEVP